MLIQEAKRLQQLAGINEVETTPADPAAEKDAQAGLKQALSILQSGENSVKPSPQDGKVDEGIGLTLGLIAGAPGLINLLGKSVNAVSSIFQKDKKKGTVVGNALKDFGHELEGYYISALGDVLKTLFPKTYENQNVKDTNSSLHKAAHALYGTILAAAAISSGVGAAEAQNIITSVGESGLSAFKASEVIALAKKVAAV